MDTLLARGGPLHLAGALSNGGASGLPSELRMVRGSSVGVTE